MSALIGVSGAKRNACAAICVDGEIRAVCEQERLTRVRRVGIGQRQFPQQAVEQVLALAGRRGQDVASYVVAEHGVKPPSAPPTVVMDHHCAHAATAFLTSPFERAAIIVCDSDSGGNRELSIWTGDGSSLQDRQWHWQGQAFASLYAECTTLFGFDGAGGPAKLEALAHLGQGKEVERLRSTFRVEDGTLRLEKGWRSTVLGMMERESGLTHSDPAETASAVQRRIGELLLDLIADVRAAVDYDAVCLSGGLFYNTYFTTLVSQAGIFRDVFVPTNPGNAGLAVGATLALAQQSGALRTATGVSPFLGPEFDDESIKLALDGCKLSYSFLPESELLDVTVDALTRGQLVGWFQGRMEWGHRALGHRSILANPRSPYVLDNLNCFLRKRERWRAFGVSVASDSVQQLLAGPPSSTYMEYEYGLRDDRFRSVIPDGASSLRAQTVTPDQGAFWALHQRMGQATGTPVLVNTSLNAFHEPIACSPVDAIRVFYGTGLDMLVMGRFLLRK